MKNYRGFSVVEGLLVMIIIGIIAGTGYFVMHAQKQTNKSLDNVAISSQEPQKSSSKAQPNNFSYFIIPEWKIKFKTQSQSQDAYYKFYQDTDQYLYLNSKDFDALKADDGSSCSGEYIAILGRYSKDDLALSAQGVDGAVGTRKTLGNYVFTFSTHKQYGAQCLFMSDYNKPNVANTAIYDKKVAAYTAMYDTIQAQ